MKTLTTIYKLFTILTLRGPRVVIYSYNKTNEVH
jgi:hypothetical protein